MRCVALLHERERLPLHSTLVPGSAGLFLRMMKMMETRMMIRLIIPLSNEATHHRVDVKVNHQDSRHETK